MLSIEELFRSLSLGELSNVWVGGSGGGDIPEIHHAKLVHFANEGLLRLFTEFRLKEDTLILNKVEGRNLHVIGEVTSKTCLDDTGSSDVPVILDTEGKPYQGNLLKILDVFAPKDVRGLRERNEPLPLNEVRNKLSLYTPAPNQLYIPDTYCPGEYRVNYQASHPKLEADDLETVIDLHPPLIPALTAFIASRVFISMGGEENMSRGNTHYAIFTSLCTTNQNKDVVNASIYSGDDRFEARGFV